MTPSPGRLSVTHITCVTEPLGLLPNHMLCVIQITLCALSSAGGATATFQRARTEENKRRRAAALVEAARSLAIETGVASVTLTAVAGRAGIHYSAVRRYFTSHKEVLLHLAAEGWVRWSGTVCAGVGDRGPTGKNVAGAGRRDFGRRSGRRSAVLRPARQSSPAPRARGATREGCRDQADHLRGRDLIGRRHRACITRAWAAPAPSTS